MARTIEIEIVGGHADVLEQERAHTRELLTAVSWARMQDRFHALDGIKDDKCPSCGGRVAADETHNAIRLRAIGREDVEALDTEIAWLRQGLETALKDLKAGRATVAINEIKGTLAGKERCW